MMIILNEVYDLVRVVMNIQDHIIETLGFEFDQYAFENGFPVHGYQRFRNGLRERPKPGAQTCG